MSEPRQRTALVVAASWEEREWLQRHSGEGCAATDVSSMGDAGRSYLCRCGSRWPTARLRMLCPTCQVPEVWRETPGVGRCSNGHAIDLSTGDPIVPTDGTERP